MNICLPQERWGPAQGKAVSILENELCRWWTLHFLFSWHVPPESVQHTLAKSSSLRCLPTQPEVCRQGAWSPWHRPHWTWLDEQPRFYHWHAKWDLVIATPGSKVNHGGNDVLPVQSQEPLMQLVLRTRCKNVEVHQFHPSVWRKQFVAQAMFRVLDLRAIVKCLIEVYH